jgi:hypothetical protein
VSNELDKSAGELLDWLKTSAEAGSGFLVEQAPLYAQEVVAWQFLCGVIFSVVFFAAALCFIAIAIRGFYRANANPRDEEAYCNVSMFLLAVSVVLVVFGSMFTADAIKAKVAPRVVIMEHVRGLAGDK